MKFIFSILLIVLFSFTKGTAQDKYKIATIAFYNLENLFDTINDTTKILSTDFTPDGPKHWDTKKYYRKLSHLSDVIPLIGADLTHTAPAILGVSEIENETVLKDLINMPKLKPYGYKIIHYESPDRRGIDVGLLYNPKVFTPLLSKNIPLTIPDKPHFYTRSQLLVTGILDGDTVSFIVMHWPSRRGGEKRSRPLRNAAADLCRAIADSILQKNPQAKIIMMGDLNDDPTSPSLKKHLKATDKKDLLTKGYFFNPMLTFYRKGIGSLAWHDSWNLFDNIILTPGAVLGNKTSYRFYQAHIFNKPFLTNTEGKFKGYPHRTFAGDNFIDGYSDHFPAYIYLIKKL